MPIVRAALWHSAIYTSKLIPEKAVGHDAQFVSHCGKENICLANFRVL
jgi:hypothetical protein